MTKTVTVTWASEEDKIGGDEFIKARRNKISEMVTANKTDGAVTHPTSESASITFADQMGADEWVAFVQALANIYNKTIVSTQIQ